MMASEKAKYEVQITTGQLFNAITLDAVYITLIGMKADKITKSERASVSIKKTAIVYTDEDLGDLIMIMLEREGSSILPESDWFCETVKVLDANKGKECVFPVFSWVLRNKPVNVAKASANKSSEGSEEVTEELNEQENQKRQIPTCKGLYDVLDTVKDISFGLLPGAPPGKVIHDLYKELNYVDMKNVFEYMDYLDGAPKSVQFTSFIWLPKTVQFHVKKLVGLGTVGTYMNRNFMMARSSILENSTQFIKMVQSMI
ncbi:arachidonate 12-lipoxygenase, 12R-type-like [Protopterus annectens]|uniref:arachidonate 12-lipoxygenase, 12R-type-like n=1 Tax=Protopterus annectens TaxID=7888 RepID=UPI001CFB4EDB|nr:arachidonate 12-lipoxygenase, 12R-type-like [Protopterus annectens]